MFIELAGALTPLYPTPDAAAEAVLTEYRPSQLSEYLETLWGTGRNAQRQLALGPGVTVNHQNMARFDVLDLLAPAPGDPPAPPPPVAWHHLAYAYMLENTRIVEIFRRVIYEYTHGERLPVLNNATQRWLHVTEQLFFNNTWSYSVRAVTSAIRPDSSAVRRNAYYRLFGMDLNHGTDDGRPYPYSKPEVANRDFAMVFETLLAEVWRGYVNRMTFVAENQTDENAINNLIRRLHEMLQSRRTFGTLSREEFDAVALISWLHLTVGFLTQVTASMNVQAVGLADRLKQIGDRVGLAPHARSDSYFELAIPISNVLLAIESGAVLNNAGALYNGPYTPDMLNVITHWSIATGRNVKDPAMRQPLGVLAATAGSGGSPYGNGGSGAPLNRLAGVLR